MRQIAKYVVLFLSSAPVLFVFWIVFVGKFAEEEMLVGMAMSVVAAVAICVAELAEDSHFRPRLADVFQIVFVPWLVAKDTLVVLLVALRDLLGGKKAESLFRLAEFESGELLDPQDTGRRVLATIYNTMSPNFIVVGINTWERRMLFHQIQKSGVSQLGKNLGARA